MRLKPAAFIFDMDGVIIDSEPIHSRVKMDTFHHFDLPFDEADLIHYMGRTSDEIFGEAEVILDDVQWRFGTGYTHYWGKSGWSYVRRIPIGDNNYRLEYSLSPKWRLRAEHFSGDNRNEFAVRYRIHEFLSAEYVYGGSEFYLRLIGNL